MWRFFTLPLRSSALPLAAMATFFGLCSVALSLLASPQSQRPRQDVHSVLSQVRLAPALRSPEVSLRFSPNGNYLLFQDPTGISVLASDPLSILFHISAEYIYPAEFSADSQALVFVGGELTFAKRKLPDGEKMASGELPNKEYCMDGKLSPGGEYFACLKPDLRFAIYEVSSQKNVLEDSLAPSMMSRSGGLRPLYPVYNLFFSPLEVDSAFSGPFGIIRTDQPRPNPNHQLSVSSIHFSPDAKVLLADFPKNPFEIDLVERKKFEPPGAVQKILPAALALQTDDRLIAVASGTRASVESSASIVSLKDGNVLAHLPLSAARLQMASNPRFVTLYNVSPDGQSATAFDLEQNRLLETPPALALDVLADELAVYTVNGSIVLYRLGERSMLAHLPLPLASLPLPRCVSFTPSLDKLALSIHGFGAIFDLSNGHRIATLPGFSAVNFLNGLQASLLIPRVRDDPARVSLINLSDGTTLPSWEVAKDEQLRSGGPVLLDYSMLQAVMNASPDFPSMGMQPPFLLRAIDPATGKELWKRQFKDNPPTPFADPQGDRLLLGWKAKTSEARSAASHNPESHELYKNAKLTDHDSFFEAFDARSGNSLGGVLVQAGSGAFSFDGGFSVGDTLILQKDSVRVSVYSMRDGQLKARLVGVVPSANAESNLLAIELALGRLGIFDLSTGTKLDEQLFPDALVYTHFSADGKLLFVLTEHQIAAILDVSGVRKPPASSSDAKKR
jgi:hypothetical protein